MTAAKGCRCDLVQPVLGKSNQVGTRHLEEATITGHPEVADAVLQNKLDATIPQPVNRADTRQAVIMQAGDAFSIAAYP